MCGGERKRIKLVIAYDGTNYRGWQIQQNGITIEEVLNKKLTELLNEPIFVIGASRTDSGVHALGNVAVFDTVHRMPGEKLCFALNQRLPDDIRIQSSCEIPKDWHPRKCNCVKTYEYRILNRKIEIPTKRLYSHFCYVPLDEQKMKEAATYLVGEHDFKSFCTMRPGQDETVRIIYDLLVEKIDDLITIRVSGSGFLYNMVRIIAGTLMKVGMGAYEPKDMEMILDAKERMIAGPKMPAAGLTLVSLEYATSLKPVITGSNRSWEYQLDQTHVEAEGAAYLVLRRCEEEYVGAVLRRVIHQAVRNGAKKVYVTDCMANRITSGSCYGYYELIPASVDCRPVLHEPMSADWRWFETTTVEKS